MASSPCSHVFLETQVVFRPLPPDSGPFSSTSCERIDIIPDNFADPAGMKPGLRIGRQRFKEATAMVLKQL